MKVMAVLIHIYGNKNWVRTDVVCTYYIFACSKRVYTVTSLLEFPHKMRFHAAPENNREMRNSMSGIAVACMRIEESESLRKGWLAHLS
jgi:hypothetical protein